MNRLVINKEKVEMITSAANRAKYDDDSRCYGIYKQSGIFDDTLVLGINWSACGTQSADVTATFAMHLTQASSMVAAINALGATVKYTKEPIYETKEEYEADYKNVYDMVVGYKTAELIAWLLDGAEAE